MGYFKTAAAVGIRAFFGPARFLEGWQVVIAVSLTLER